MGFSGFICSFSFLLQVTPFLLIGAEYGHLITLWRLSAFGNAIYKLKTTGGTQTDMSLCLLKQVSSSASPSQNSTHLMLVRLTKKVNSLLLNFELLIAWSFKRMFAFCVVENAQKRIVEAWGICTHKKFVAGSMITAFWNLTSLKIRFFTG